MANNNIINNFPYKTLDDFIYNKSDYNSKLSEEFIIYKKQFDEYLHMFDKEELLDYIQEKEQKNSDINLKFNLNLEPNGIEFLSSLNTLLTDNTINTANDYVKTMADEWNSLFLDPSLNYTSLLNIYQKELDASATSEGEKEKLSSSVREINAVTTLLNLDYVLKKINNPLETLDSYETAESLYNEPNSILAQQIGIYTGTITSVSASPGNTATMGSPKTINKEFANIIESYNNMKREISGLTPDVFVFYVLGCVDYMYLNNTELAEKLPYFPFAIDPTGTGKQDLTSILR